MITVTAITNKLPAQKVVQHYESTIDNIVQIDAPAINKTSILWCNNKNLHLIENLKTGTLICSEKALDLALNKNINYIIVSNPRSYFRELVVNFFYKGPKHHGISPLANIHPSVKIGTNTSIGNYVTIEENCVIGDNTFIGHNTVLLEGTKIGNHVVIGSNNTIGGNGFGYEKDETGAYQLMPHIGSVWIEDYVEIGNNTCIDRGVLGATHIKKNAKIDNLVHIAHGVVVGENSLIIANAMIGGSTIIGDNVWVAPSASLINKITIGNNSLVGMGAVVVKNVEEDKVVMGNPAKSKQ